jgi:hypothetical protein
MIHDAGIPGPIKWLLNVRQFLGLLKLSLVDRNNA